MGEHSRDNGSVEVPTYVLLSPLVGMLCARYCGGRGKQFVSSGLSQLACKLRKVDLLICKSSFLIF